MPNESSYQPTKSVVAEETICCGYKRCPTVRVYEDGSVEMTDDGQHIEFNADQAKSLLGMLQSSLKKE